jgi:hypothetical protein
LRGSPPIGDHDRVNESWALAARYLSRYRGALLGGIGSATAVALTMDPQMTIASSSIRFAFWFAMAATVCAVALTTALTIAEHRAARPTLPRAKAKYTYN